ncbi:MAG: DJ-1/PfpI family protein [Candidatus Omnitrophica bacterium]|nr:DJ-1/PfpI family protein [Candidatus Omnitrophota bacterium]
MQKALIILANGFEEIEAIATIDILRRSGVNVTIAGLDSVQIASARLVKIFTDKILTSNDLNYDALILPGGANGAKNLAASALVKQIINKMFNEKKLIAAICASPAEVLAPTGILNNKSATGYPGDEALFNKSTKVKTDKVVIDGNIITSQGPGTAADFSFAIVNYLVGKEISDKVKKAMLFV